jgi:hypothetical protein
LKRIAGVIGITSKDSLRPRNDLLVSSFNRTLADVLHVWILRVPSQATDVIIILMTVALKLADPGIGESGDRPQPHMDPTYIRPAEGAKTPVIESPI